MNPLLRAATVATALMAMMGASARAESAPVSGVLPNGLRYVIRPCGGEEPEVSLRLYVAVGSFDETDSELGYAHFVEHMAFDGTTHFPPGAIAKLFQSFGLAWGADLNANTHENRTVYLLELPYLHRTEMATALSVLRDYADGIQFAPAQVKREAGVVVSEMHMRQGRLMRDSRSVEEALYATTLLPHRDPLGTEASVLSATAESLRGFYRRCYLPSRMTVVVTGPVDAAEVGRAIGEAFASMPVRVGPAPVRLTAPSPDPGIDPWVFSDPDMNSAELYYLYTGPRPADTPEGRMEELKNRLVISILNQRLLRRRELVRDHFGLPQASVEVEDAGPFLRRQIEVQANFENLGVAVWAVENELKAARQTGFSDIELKEAIAVELARLHNRTLAASADRSKAVANEIVDDLSQGRTYLPALDEEKEAVTAGASLTMKDLDHTLVELFPPDRATLIARGGPKAPISASDLNDLYETSQNRSAVLLPPAQEVRLAYDGFGTPGTLVRSRVDPKIGVTTAAFANGVLLNFKPMTIEPGRFMLRVGLGRGIYDILPGKAAYPALADGLFRACDLRRQPNSEVTEVLALHGVSYQNSMVDGGESVLIEGPSAELPLALKVITARLTDTHYEEDRVRNALAFYAAQHEQTVETPASAALFQGVYLLAGSDARVLLPSVSDASYISFGSIYAWLKEHWLRGPVELGIVGDLDFETVKRAVGSTLGTLSTRKTPSRQGAPKHLLTRPRNLVETQPMQAGAAGCCLFWPMTLNGGARQLAAVGLAADILSDRYRRSLRDTLGATYTPSVFVRRDRYQRDFGYAVAVLTFDSARATELRDRAIEIAEEVAASGASPEEFMRLKEPRLAKVKFSLRSERWWLDSVVSYAQGSEENLSEAEGFESAHETLTLNEVNEALGFFAKANASSVIVVPQPPSP